MAQLPAFSKLLPESFPNLPWLPEFARPLNAFMQSVTDALNGKLTVSENMEGVVKTITVDGTYPVSFAWTRSNKPAAAWIGQCREVSGNHTTVTTALYLDWEFNAQGQLQINNVAGLSASPTAKFNVTIVAITG